MSNFLVISILKTVDYISKLPIYDAGPKRRLSPESDKMTFRNGFIYKKFVHLQLLKFFGVNLFSY